MEDKMISIRQDLRKFRNELENDFEEFQSKLNLTRKHVGYFIDQQIEYLKRFENEINEDLNYLERQNEKTCEDNKYEFDRLCLAINQNDQNLTLVQQLLTDFQTKFHLRPKMIQSIPQFQFKDIHIDDFIIKQSDSNSSNQSFSEKSQSPLTMSIVDKLVYKHNRKPRSICLNVDENYFLIYSFHFNEFECLLIENQELISIKALSNETIFSLGYSRSLHLFYCSIRQTNRLILFRIDLQKQRIEIENDIELIDKDQFFINIHVYNRCIYYLYLTSTNDVYFAQFDFDKSSLISTMRIPNCVYENQQKYFIKILDFSVDDSLICFLIQLKSENRSQIHVYNRQSMTKIHSFDLIDAIKPISIISSFFK